MLAGVRQAAAVVVVEHQRRVLLEAHPQQVTVAQAQPHQFLAALSLMQAVAGVVEEVTRHILLRVERAVPAVGLMVVKVELHLMQQPTQAEVAEEVDTLVLDLMVALAAPALSF